MPCPHCNGTGKALYRSPFLIDRNDPERSFYTCTMVACEACGGTGKVSQDQTGAEARETV